MQEIWKPIEGFEGYEVSNMGRIKSFHKDKNGRILKPKNNGRGYYQAELSKNKKSYMCAYQRLVAQHFIPKVDGKNEVNHIDGNKHNNVYTNLEWCTRGENVSHSFKIGLRNMNHNPIFAEKPVKCIELNYVAPNRKAMNRHLYDLGVTKSKDYSCISKACKTHKPYLGLHFENFEGEINGTTISK